MSTAPRAIWKFTLYPGTAWIEMPKGAKVVHVHAQDGRLCVWAEVDPAAPKVRRALQGVVTGGNPNGARYVGTAHLDGGTFVIHVYDGGELGPC